jgi:hypothetical protein
MLARFIRLAILIVTACTLFAQDAEQDRVLHFTSDVTPQAMQETLNIIRAVADIQRVTPDSVGKGLTVTADPARLALAEWLFHELDQPSGKAVAPYEFTGNRDPSVRVFRLAKMQSPRDMQELVNVLRVTADCARVLPFNPGTAIALRGTADQAAVAEWVVRNLDVPEGIQPPSSRAKPLTTLYPGVRDPVVRIFFLEHAELPIAMQEMVNIIRTIADIPRVFPLNGARAMIIRGNEGQIAMSEWLLHEMDQKPSGQAAESGQRATFSTYGDAVEARVFHLAHLQDPRAVQEAINTLRANVGIQRVMASSAAQVVALRANADQVARAEKLIAERDQ